MNAAQLDQYYSFANSQVVSQKYFHGRLQNEDEISMKMAEKEEKL